VLENGNREEVQLRVLENVQMAMGTCYPKPGGFLKPGVASFGSRYQATPASDNRQGQYLHCCSHVWYSPQGHMCPMSVWHTLLRVTNKQAVQVTKIIQ
jgi:hypothetical protein